MKPPSPPNTNPLPVAAFGWYKPEQWARLREISEDRDDLDDTFADWQANAQKQVERFEREGFQVVKVPVEVELLRRWCKRRKRPVNAAARSEYALYRLRKRHSP